MAFPLEALKKFWSWKDSFVYREQLICFLKFLRGITVYDVVIKKKQMTPQEGIKELITGIFYFSWYSHKSLVSDSYKGHMYF